MTRLLFAGSMTVLFAGACATAQNAAVPVAAVTTPEPSVESQQSAAEVLVKAGKVEEAVGLYRSLSERQPAESAFWLRLGQLEQRQRRYLPAEKAFRAVLKQNKSEPQAISGLIQVLRASNRCADALEFAEGVEHNGSSSLSTEQHLELAACQRATKRFEAAETRLRTALSERPDDVKILNALALVYFDQSKLQLSQATLLVALTKQEKDEALHVNLGVVLWRLNRPAEAQVHFERALALNARSSAALFNAGALALSYRDHSTAARYLKGAFELESESVEVLMAYAFALDGLKATDPAQGTAAGQLFERVVTLSSNDAAAVCGAGWAYTAQQQTWDKARQFLERCKAFDSTSATERTRIESKLKGLSAQEAGAARVKSVVPAGNKASLVDSLSTEAAAEGNVPAGADAGVNSP